jgi:hypothetical protein
MKTSNYYDGLLRYQKKVFDLPFLVKEFDQVRKGKQINDSKVMLGILGGLACGENSLSGLARHTDVSRSVLEDFLQLEGLATRLRGFTKSMLKRMKRGKMINLPNVKGKYLASVDGVETMRRKYTPAEFYAMVERGHIDSICQVAVHRDSRTKEILSFSVYHRMVVVCMITDRGPLPIAWRYQHSESGKKYAAWIDKGSKSEEHPAEDLSEEKAKQEGELTVLAQLLPEIKVGFGGKMPFDILMGDGLYDKGTVLTQVESYGIALISVQKDERRSIRKDAEEDFNTRKPDAIWSENKRNYEGWVDSYPDENIKRDDKNVKIVRIIRENKDGSKVDNYFYCSNKTWITTRLVEWCRHYRWVEENGFNAWTNLWGVLKHVFHNSASACDAMIGLFFITFISVQNYRKGNLKRGCHHFYQTLKDFFIAVAAGYRETKRKIMAFLRKYLYSTHDTG